MKHRLRSTIHVDPATKKPLYWSGEYGWVAREEADLFDTDSIAGHQVSHTEIETVITPEFSLQEFATVVAALHAWAADRSAEIALDLYQYHSKSPPAATAANSRFAAATQNWQELPLLSDQVDALVRRITAEAKL